MIKLDTPKDIFNTVIAVFSLLPPYSEMPEDERYSAIDSMMFHIFPRLWELMHGPRPDPADLQIPGVKTGYRSKVHRKQ